MNNVINDRTFKKYFRIALNVRFTFLFVENRIGNRSRFYSPFIPLLNSNRRINKIEEEGWSFVTRY